VSADFPVPDMADVELIDVLRAVADPIRLEMIRVLSDGERHCKTAADWGFDVHKSTLSHHFKALREAGVTLTVVDGRNHYIQLRRRELDERFPGLVDALIAGARV
jgi:DNA-binding transcriptional ArsR family regulator